MILIVCLPCRFCIRVMPDSVTSTQSLQEVDQLVGKHSDFWPASFPCLRCGLMARGLFEREAAKEALEAFTLQDLTAKEAFAAFNGFGLPEEQDCSLATVNELLRTRRVARVLGKDVPGSRRTLLEALEFEDGTRLYLGASADGAVVYRIARQVSYAHQVLKEMDP